MTKWLIALLMVWASVARAQAPTPTPCTGSVAVPSPQMAFCWGVGTYLTPPPFSNCNAVPSYGTAAWSNIKCNTNLCLSQCASTTPTTEEYGVGLVQWTVPALPMDAVITTATVQFPFSAGSNEDNLSALGEWYHAFTMPGSSADYSTSPSSSAFDMGPILSVVCPSNICTVPLTAPSANIPTTGGVAALRLWLSSASVTSCNGWQMHPNAILTVNYSFTCGAETPTPGTPTETPTTVLTPTVPIATQTANAQATETQGAQATQTRNAQETQTAAPTNTPPPTVTGTIPTATRTQTPTITPTPNTQLGCCVCPGQCGASVSAELCPIPCTFGGVGTVCVLVN